RHVAILSDCPALGVPNYLPLPGRENDSMPRFRYRPRGMPPIREQTFHYITCGFCGCHTGPKGTPAEAAEVWNRADLSEMWSGVSGLSGRLRWNLNHVRHSLAASRVARNGVRGMQPVETCSQ